MSVSDNATPHRAEVYDEQVRNTLPFYDTFHDQTIGLIKVLNLKPNLWLDVGCGTGTMVEKAITVFPDTHFVLSDPSPNMLKIAKTKLNNPKVEFLEASSTQNIVWTGKRFDVITAIQSHHYQSPQGRHEATAFCFKMLGPKGVYVTFENIRPLTTRGVEVSKALWKQYQLSKGRDLASVEVNVNRFGIEFQPITIKEHLTLLRKIGFSVVEVLWYSYMQAGFYGIK